MWLVWLIACNPPIEEEGACPDEYADSPLCTEWVINGSEETAAVIESDGPVLVDVTSISVDGGLVEVMASGVPSYTVTITQDVVDGLNARPRAATDFVSGQTTAIAGQTVQFGEDIGYDSTGCAGDEGAGYWPPGPMCPEDVGHVSLFPLEPEPETGELCDTSAGAIGLWVNGASVFNWADTFSYDDEGQWRIIAPVAEAYDADICGGHAAGDEYHHHSASACLADLVGDDGTGHSPIYGFAADGYPIHGIWHGALVESLSCWETREYTNSSPTGCGIDAERSCVLVDPLDPSAGTTPAAASGPDTSATFTSLSGNTFQATSGLFYEDHYFDTACPDAGDATLDEHNGHDHDGLGYHYHLTTSFPYTPGPTLYGVVDESAGWRCDGVDAQPMP